MAYKCEICGKGVMYGHAVSHAKNRIARVFSPNLRKASISVNGKVTKIAICTDCFSRAKIDGRYVKSKVESGKWKMESGKEKKEEKTEKIEAISVAPAVMEETPKKKTTKKASKSEPKVSTPEINIDDIVGTK